MCSALSGGCVYLRHFLCEGDDYSIIKSLTQELEEQAVREEEAGGDGCGRGGMINWSKHLKYENPDFSPTFQSVRGNMM